MLTPRGKPSQYYIKRLVGVPGDTLQVRSPQLFINGNCAEEKGMQRVMSGTPQSPKDGYQGYGYRPLLNHPDAPFTQTDRE